MQASYITLLVLFLVLFIQHRNERLWIKQFIKKRKNREDRICMLELAKRFIGKECIIYSFNNQFTGTIQEVTDGAILLKSNETVEAVNLDFVIRIREYPRKKNGKKKGIILD